LDWHLRERWWRADYFHFSGTLRASQGVHFI